MIELLWNWHGASLLVEDFSTLLRSKHSAQHYIGHKIVCCDLEKLNKTTKKTAKLNIWMSSLMRCAYSVPALFLEHQTQCLVTFMRTRWWCNTILRTETHQDGAFLCRCHGPYGNSRILWCHRNCNSNITTSCGSYCWSRWVIDFMLVFILVVLSLFASPPIPAI